MTDHRQLGRTLIDARHLFPAPVAIRPTLADHAAQRITTAKPRPRQRISEQQRLILACALTAIITGLACLFIGKAIANTAATVIQAQEQHQ